MRYECDFVVQGDDGAITIRQVRSIDAPTRLHAVQWIEERVGGAPDIFRVAHVIRLRYNGKVVWLKALAGSQMPEAT